MEKKLKVFQIGCGKMSKYTMRYVYEHGGQIVGAVDINLDLVGKDIADIMDCEDKKVLIDNVDNLEALLEETKPDIAIVTTMSLLSDLKEVLMTCAKCGVNAITTCEEAFFASNSNPNLFEDIDALAKANNCTIVGSGYHDFAWGHLVAAMASSVHKITKIKGSSSYNVEDYGIALAKAHGAGLSLEDFETEVASSDNITEEERKKQIENGNFMPSYMWNVVGWLADKLNLHIITQTQKCIPKIDEEDLTSSTLKMTIKAGDATGMSAIVTAETAEGITLEAECIGKVYNENEFDQNIWTIEGEPDLTVEMDRPDTVKLTCANIVNRLVDVINSKPGFISTSKLPELKYLTKPFNEYLK